MQEGLNPKNNTFIIRSTTIVKINILARLHQRSNSQNNELNLPLYGWCGDNDDYII
jgi:hypothetical protein